MGKPGAMIDLIKKQLFRIMIMIPFLWWGLTATAACITGYHGYAAYFVYAALVMLLIFIPLVLLNYKAFYLFSTLMLMEAILFDIYGMILLFFPQWNGWNGWDGNVEYGGWTLISFNVPVTFGYGVLILFLGIFLVFATKKYFEIDYNAMQKEAFKEHIIDSEEQKIILSNPAALIAGATFKVKYLKKVEYWLYTAGFFLLCVGILPMNRAGSTMAHFGNSPFLAFFFFVASYFLVWLACFCAIGSFSQYILINKIEKELGFKLQPVLKAEGERERSDVTQQHKRK